MSEPDEPQPRRRRRRSLRVPLDEVHRSPDGEEAVDLGDTQETPIDAAEGPSDTPELEVATPEAHASREPDAERLGAARDESSDAPLEGEPTQAAVSPPPQAPTGGEGPTIGGAAEADEEHPAVEVQLDDAPHAEEAPEPAPEPSRATRSVAVIVQRVVAVSSPVTTRPPPEEPSTEAEAEDELSVEIDEEPELRLSEPDAAELEELEVELDESAHEPAVELRASEPDATTELALEDADAFIEEDGDRAAGKRTSIRPPPPPSKPKEAPSSDAPAGPPPPPEGVSASAPPAVAKRKRARRAWWEELFNDDYLRTVPIPQPAVIERQCDFIEQRFGLAPGATLLDVGCGLGLHAVELTRRGYAVVGLDLSPSMLSRAVDEAQDHGLQVSFLHADMREMSFEGVFDAILCYGTTFGYFDDETNKQVVQRLYRALKPRGLLLLDVVNRDYVIRNQPNLVWFEGDGCVVMEESQMNYITSRLEVKRTVILDDGRQRENVYSLRSYSLHELGQILHQQGFRVVEVTGWEAHPGVFFGGDSPKLIILAERRPQGPPMPPARPPSGEVAALTDPPPVEPPPPEPAEEPSSESAQVKAEDEEPSKDVSAALAEALEQSTELEIEPESEAAAEDLEPEELEPEDLAEEELEEPES